MKPNRSGGASWRETDFCLPGNPVAAFMHTFVSTALAVMGGSFVKPLMVKSKRFSHKKKPGRANIACCGVGRRGQQALFVHGRRGQLFRL